MPELKRVFEPVDVGGVTLPNRICRSAHGTGSPAAASPLT